MNEFADKVDDLSDAGGNAATMLRQRFQKQLPGPGPGTAHTGTPEVPVIVERGQQHERLGTYDLVSNMVIMATVLVKGGELVAEIISAKFKERRSEHGR